MTRNKYFIFLSLIFTLGLILRLYKINSMPPLNADEAALGYNAYSLILTGKDEHGNSWPIHFQSFNDYKPGGYVYLLLPMVYFFGLNVISIRIVSAILGSLAPVLLAMFVNTWFGNMQKEKKVYFSLATALMLVISPWHIHFSRGAWEVNVATFFMLVGALFFSLAAKKPKFYLLAIVAFVCSLYVYHTARVVAPLMGLGIMWIRRAHIKRNLRMFALSLAVGMALVTPLVYSVFFAGGLLRARGVGITADLGLINRINELRGQHTEIAGMAAKLLHNKPLQYGLEFVSNWGEHYKGEFLFVSGDEIQRNKVPETGLLYLVEIVFILFAGATIAKNTKGWGFIFWWLIIAPIAAAFTFQSPNALRAQNMTIPLAIFSGYGLSQIFVFSKRQKQTMKIGLYVIIILSVLWSLTRYLLMYYKHLPKEYPYSSQYGFSEMVDFLKQEEAKFQSVFITTRYDQPYIMLLYYKKYPPALFQEGHKLSEIDNFGFSTVENFAKYSFQKIDFYALAHQNSNSLIIGTDEEIPEEANIVKEIYFPNGNIAFQIVAN